jgi:predicted SprT family Zn-dependent metalloprotease
VLRAVGCVLSKKPEPTRAGAKEAILRFLRANPPEAKRPTRRGKPAADRAEVERLAAEFDRVNERYFHAALPRVPISLSGRMRRRNGHFSTHPVEIVISRALCRHAEPGEAEKTLRHEMIHLWQHEQGRKPGHGQDFRRWAERLGVHPRATRNVSWKCETN